ncbi:MAG: hypothetical protein LBP70_03400 [Mycoplasmataceae bacterium]|nr:hypothetical protein [Mycoplasmataceae bacterium]
MNFIAIIGIVEKLSKNIDDFKLTIKVEKPLLDFNDEEWYEIVDVDFDKETLVNEIKEVSPGTIIGVKGHIKNINQQMHLIAERIQVF